MSRPKRTGPSKRPSWESALEDVRVPLGGAPELVCVHCGRSFPDQAPGTGQRNHCPFCLWSRHVDVRPGDRASLCAKPMEPVALWVAESGELRVIHRCSGCGILKPNRLAGDDSEEVVAEIADRLRDRMTDGQSS
ncbi:MAG: RNHCP domain-containing protein [Spirochaetales bacterium]